MSYEHSSAVSGLRVESTRAVEAQVAGLVGERLHAIAIVCGPAPGFRLPMHLRSQAGFVEGAEVRVWRSLEERGLAAALPRPTVERWICGLLVWAGSPPAAASLRASG